MDCTIQRWQDGESREILDCLAVEEPLEIRLNGAPLVVTMRSPGEDRALALGFLLTEGIIGSLEDVWDVTRCGDEPGAGNVLDVVVSPARAALASEPGRQRYASSACGICGRASIESVRARAPAGLNPFRPAKAVILSLPLALSAVQPLFLKTGGIHAAGLFSMDGRLVASGEDVGRHNAADKAIGAALLAGRLNDCAILLASGRAGFEIVQKAAAVGVPAVCSVSAPSSLAVALARDAGMTLIGFLRGSTMNVYSGEVSPE